MTVIEGTSPCMLLPPLRGRQGKCYEICPKLEVGQMSQGMEGNGGVSCKCRMVVSSWMDQTGSSLKKKRKMRHKLEIEGMALPSAKGDKNMPIHSCAKEIVEYRG